MIIETDDATVSATLAQRAHLFKEGVEKGYFIKRANGDVWQ
jgi:alpha-D-xyloside xylohydrolase